MSERDLPNLQLMLEMVQRIQDYTKSIHSSGEFECDLKTFDACLMDFIVIGELVAGLSDKFIAKNDDIEWDKIRAFRNLAAHQYFGVLPEKVWEIIQTKIPELKTYLEKIIK